MQIHDLILVYLTSAALLAVVFLWIRQQNLRRRQMEHLERMAAIDKGVMPESQGGDASLLAGSASQPTTLEWFRLTTLGMGFLLLFGGTGVLVGLLIVEDAGLRSLWSLGLIPIMAGFGLLAFSLLSRKLSQ